jgi:hypothetical protein
VKLDQVRNVDSAEAVLKRVSVSDKTLDSHVQNLSRVTEFHGPDGSMLHGCIGQWVTLQANYFLIVTEVRS